MHLSALQAGRVLVAVRGSDERLAHLGELMTGYRTVDVAPGAQQQGEIVLPVMEERLAVGKREVERGGVRVYSHVTERPVEETVRLREERVTVERRPIDQPVSPEGPGAFQEGSFEVRQSAEVPVVAKQARVIEEVVIGKQVSERTETVRDTVRRADVEVEQLAPQDPRTEAAEDADFRKHSAAYEKSGYTYEQVAPAYRYGHSLGSANAYRDKDWSKIEADAREHWEEKNPNTWERFKDAIRYGWERVHHAVS